MRVVPLQFQCCFEGHIDHRETRLNVRGQEKGGFLYYHAGWMRGAGVRGGMRRKVLDETTARFL